MIIFNGNLLKYHNVEQIYKFTNYTNAQDWSRLLICQPAIPSHDHFVFCFVFSFPLSQELYTPSKADSNTEHHEYWEHMLSALGCLAQIYKTEFKPQFQVPWEFLKQLLKNK